MVSVLDASIVVVTGVGGGAFLIAAVALDSETVLPNPFRAVTSTRIECPTSALRTPYAWAVAPEMSVQPPPEASQRRHWNANLSTAPPPYLPGSATSCSPTNGLPVIVGGLDAVGAVAGVIGSVGFEFVGGDEPAEFFAVTSTTIA